MFPSMKGLLTTKKSKKSVKKGEELISLPIIDISNSIYRTKDNKYKITAKVSPINGELLSDEEITEVFEAIQGALNTFNGRIQIAVQSEKVDIDDNVQYIDNNINALKSELKVILLSEQRKHLKNMRNKSRNVLNFYVGLESDHDKYAVAEQSLKDAVSNIRHELENQCMYVTTESDKDFMKLIYERLHPETSIVEPFQDHWGLHEITPKYIKQFSHGRYIEIDNRYYRFFYISNYPKTVKQFRWLNRLFKVNGDINISFMLTPKDRSKIQRELSNAAREIGSKAIDTRLPKHLQMKYEKEKESAEKLIEELGSENTNLYDVNVTISISAKSLEELETLSVSLRSAVSSSYCQAVQIRNKGLDPLWVTLPIVYDCSITRDYVWNLTSADIASIIPFDSSELMESKGVFIGENVTSNSLIILDMLDRQKYNNGHMAVLAETGAGKTFYLMLDAMRHYPYVDYIIIFNLKQGDFMFPWGQRYVFNPSSGIITNPFHIRSIYSANNDNYGQKDLSGVLANKIMDLIVFFRWILPDMSPFDEALLEEDIREAYSRVGLNFESKELPSEFPTMSTLEQVTQDAIDDPARSQKEKEHRINRKASLNPYTNGAYAKMFNGQTNWEYDPWTVMDISSVSDAIKQPLYEILLKDTWSFCKKDGTRNPETKRVYVDETHIFADPKNPQTLKFISTELIKQGRGFGVDLVTATQNIQDYLSIERYGHAIIDNSLFKVIFRLGENDRPLVRELFGFSDKEMKILAGNNRGRNKGRGLFIAGNLRVQMQVTASKFELEVIDPEQYELIYGEKSRYRSV